MKIVDVFDKMGHPLLILGEPGSGKTTTLLELARDTIARAEKDPTEPIPVVFNLSSWTDSKQSIADWLVNELNTKYKIPRTIARPWIENDELLLLLDGLDEVALERREKCIEAINEFRQERLVPLVVSSRVADYEALGIQLKLQSAVLLQPLTPQQVNDYLDKAGQEFAAVREALKKDTSLQELAQSPLTLSIMTLAYRGMSVEDLQPLETTEGRRRHLFDTYVQQMFKHRGADKRYSPEQTIHWLSWLAQKMSQHAQSVFLIERMQPSWLQTYAQPLYRVGLVLIFGLIFGLFCGLFGGLLGGLIFGLLLGLLFAIVFGFRDIYTIEVLKWRPLKVLKGKFLILGLSVGLSVGLIAELVKLIGKLDVEHFTLISWLISGLTFGLIFELIFGLRSEEIETKTVPNQGIRQTAKNAVILGLIFGLIAGLPAGLFGGLGLAAGLCNGLIVGLMVVLILGGGEAFIRHYLLRFILYRNGHIPWNYARFLDYAAERIFLRKVGGGYIFVHRLLMDYFVSLEPEQGGG